MGGGLQEGPSGPLLPGEGRGYLARPLACTMEAQKASIPTRRMQAETRRKKRTMKATARAMPSQGRSLLEQRSWGGGGGSVRSVGLCGTPPYPRPPAHRGASWPQQPATPRSSAAKPHRAATTETPETKEQSEGWLKASGTSAVPFQLTAP